MIPTIGLLLCVYLVFKGCEIYMLYHTSARDDNAGQILGILAVIASFVIAGFFGLIFLTSGSGTSLP